MPDCVKKLYQHTNECFDQIALKDKADVKILEMGCGIAYLAKIHSG